MIIDKTKEICNKILRMTDSGASACDVIRYGVLAEHITPYSTVESSGKRFKITSGFQTKIMLF